MLRGVRVQEPDVVPVHVLFEEVQGRGLPPEAHQQQARGGDGRVQGHRAQQGTRSLRGFTGASC